MHVWAVSNFARILVFRTGLVYIDSTEIGKETQFIDFYPVCKSEGKTSFLQIVSSQYYLCDNHYKRILGRNRILRFVEAPQMRNYLSIFRDSIGL